MQFAIGDPIVLTEYSLSGTCRTVTGTVTEVISDTLLVADVNGRTVNVTVAKGEGA